MQTFLIFLGMTENKFNKSMVMQQLLVIKLISSSKDINFDATAIIDASCLSMRNMRFLRNRIVS